MADGIKGLHSTVNFEAIKLMNPMNRQTVYLTPVRRLSIGAWSTKNEKSDDKNAFGGDAIHGCSVAIVG
jgi:hypothetical protein